MMHHRKAAVTAGATEIGESGPRHHAKPLETAPFLRLGLPRQGAVEQNAGMDLPPTAETDDVPRLPAAQRRGVIEVDTFCPGCHYNLHGQAVTVDDRLDIPVCRCPECGRFHPAGVGVTASSVWVRRLATVLLFNWVAVVIAATVAICFFMGVISEVSVDVYAEHVMVTPDGRPVAPLVGQNGSFTGQHVIAGTNAPVQNFNAAEVLHPIWGGPAVSDNRYDAANPYNYVGVGPATYPSLHEAGPGWTPWLWAAVGSVTLGCLAATLCVTLLWHWPRRRYAWCLLLPFVAGSFLSVVYGVVDQYQLDRGQAIGRAALMGAVQALGVLVGTRVGRPIARAVVSVVVPPKPRQALVFLWQVDGKTMPV